jgi:hypothetical protein
MGHGFSRFWSFRPFSDVQVVDFDRLEQWHFAFFVPRVDACFREERFFRNFRLKGFVWSVRGLCIVSKLVGEKAFCSVEKKKTLGQSTTRICPDDL